jgi:hypothetical protein
MPHRRARVPSIESRERVVVTSITEADDHVRIVVDDEVAVADRAHPQIVVAVSTDDQGVVAVGDGGGVPVVDGSRLRFSELRLPSQDQRS